MILWSVWISFAIVLGWVAYSVSLRRQTREAALELARKEREAEEARTRAAREAEEARRKVEAEEEARRKTEESLRAKNHAAKVEQRQRAWRKWGVVVSLILLAFVGWLLYSYVPGPDPQPGYDVPQLQPGYGVGGGFYPTETVQQGLYNPVAAGWSPKCDTHLVHWENQLTAARNCRTDPQEYLRIMDFQNPQRNLTCTETAHERDLKLGQACGWLPLVELAWQGRSRT